MVIIVCVFLRDPCVCHQDRGPAHEKAQHDLLRPQAFLDRSGPGVKDKTRPSWLDRKLWRRFVEYNMGKYPLLCRAQGSPEEVLAAVQEALADVPSGVPVPGIPAAFIQHVPFVALELEVNSGICTRYITVIDRVTRIRGMLRRIVDGKIKPEDYEAALHISVYPRYHMVYFNVISLGREIFSHNRGRRYMSATFEKIALRLIREHPGLNISTVAAAGATEHWLRKYFEAHLTTPEAYAALIKYVPVPIDDYGSLLFGRIVPRPAGAANAESPQYTAFVEALAGSSV